MVTLEHQYKWMIGKEVTVNGTTYTVDGQRRITGMAIPDAQKLLLSAVWNQVPEPKKKVAPVAPTGALAAPPPAEPEPPEPPAPSPEFVDPPVPAEGDEWPDPDPRMSWEFLRQMADAYEVKAPRTLKPETLVKRLRAAMYE